VWQSKFSAVGVSTSQGAMGMRFDGAFLALAVLTVPAVAQSTGTSTNAAATNGTGTNGTVATGTAQVKVPPVAARLSSHREVRLTENSDLLGGPLLGYALRADLSGIHPLHGFPGASFPGPALTLSQAVGTPAVSSVASLALAAGERPGELLLYGLRSDSASARLLPSVLTVNTQPDQIVFSPLGQSALLYDRGRRQIEVLAALQRRPLSLYTASLAGIQGMLTALAISDDGLARFTPFAAMRPPRSWPLCAALSISASFPAARMVWRRIMAKVNCCCSETQAARASRPLPAQATVCARPRPWRLPPQAASWLSTSNPTWL
jgi:hypothetical protein